MLNSTTGQTLTFRPSQQRGHADHGWLDTRYTFSFSDYYDPKWTHFRALRVINEDVVAPGQGFGMHPHNDMEIITVVLSGQVEHRDSMGNVGTINPGEVQVMSAGTGVLHSEYNPSSTDPVHLLQIWLFPERKGLKPAYAQQRFDTAEREGKLQLLASRTDEDGSMHINQDAKLFAASLKSGDKVEHTLASGRNAWLQVISGELSVAGQKLSAGDGLGIHDGGKLEITASADKTQFLLFDLA